MVRTVAVTVTEPPPGVPLVTFKHYYGASSPATVRVSAGWNIKLTNTSAVISLGEGGGGVCVSNIIYTFLSVLLYNI